MHVERNAVRIEYALCFLRMTALSSGFHPQPPSQRNAANTTFSSALMYGF